MLKGQIVKRLKALHPEYSVEDLEEVVNLVFDTISEALSQGRRVEIRGFGSFSINKQKGKLFTNPKTGKTIKCPSNYRIVFKPGKLLKKKIEP